jgi:hypothetical protein
VNSVVGGFSVGETPGPIPNPEAKPYSADGTALARVWESRTPPTFNLQMMEGEFGTLPETVTGQTCPPFFYAHIPSFLAENSIGASALPRMGWQTVAHLHDLSICTI